MGEMIEGFKLLKEHERERRKRNLAEANPEGWEIKTEYHWQRRVDGELIDYWPSRNKWRYKNKTRHGSVEAFIRKITGPQ